MSWIDRIQNIRLSVFMGDGTEFTPLWKNARLRQDFNISEFNFPGVEGTLVKRREPKGATYDIEFYFVGDDHLDVADEFKAASVDSRHWHITHPYYGNIRVQPISLRYDNSEHNVTAITGTVMETILGDFPRSLENPTDVIFTGYGVSDLSSGQAYSSNVTTPAGQDIVTMESTVNFSRDLITKSIDDDEDYANYINQYRKAISAINQAANNANLAMLEIQSFINKPVFFKQTAIFRVNLLLDQFNKTRDLILGTVLDDVPISQRRYYESFAGSIISNMFLASSIDFTGSDYETTVQVNDVVTILFNTFQQYLDDLNDLQFIDESEEDRYVADQCAIEDRNDLFAETIQNLFNIALETKQEVIVSLDRDSNIILLTHRYYGLDEEDENMQFFIRTNNISISKHLQIKKGTEIKYYI